MPYQIIRYILPKDFRFLAYETGSSELSVDGGPWEEVPDPDLNSDYKLLKWPRDYDKDGCHSASNPAGCVDQKDAKFRAHLP